MGKITREKARALMGAKLREVRERAGKSRAEVVKEVGIGRSTLERMEAGTSPVEISDFMNIYDVCNANPFRDFYMITNSSSLEKLPKLLQSLNLPSEGPEYEKAWKETYKLMKDTAKSCNLMELMIINYLLSNEYGGDRYAFLNKCAADAQCPAGSRSVTCSVIANNYEDALSMGLLPENRLPVDLDAIKEANERGKMAHREGKQTYL